MPSASRNSAGEKVGGLARREVVTKAERWKAKDYSGSAHGRLLGVPHRPDGKRWFHRVHPKNQ
jgi:hypothetical protein